MGIVRFSRTIALASTFLTPTGGAPAPEGALALLSGETDGFAIDATTYDSVTAASYVGGPVGGTVATIDTGTPANDLSNVPLDASNLVNSGTSPKMVHNASSPYVRWSAHNLCTQSQTFDNVAWSVNSVSISANDTTAPDGTATADKLTASAATDAHVVFGTATSGLAASTEGTASVYVKKSTAQFFQLVADFGTDGWFAGVFDLDGASVTETAAGASGTVSGGTITSVGSGWYRVTVTGSVSSSATLIVSCHIVDSGTPTQGSFGNVTFNAAGTEAVWIWGAQLNRGPIATPYLATTTAARIGIPLSYDAAAAQYGILVEPAATNLGLRSEELSNAAWTVNNATVTADDTTAPDGTTTADKLVETNTSDASIRITNNITISAGSTYTVSIYVKRSNIDWFVIYVADTAGFSHAYAWWFDILNGVVGSGANQAGTRVTMSNPQIVDVGNGYYRVSANVVNSTDSTAMVFLTSATADLGTTRVSSGTYWAWGFQFELGTVATSYIPTLGSTVTRAADDVTCVSTSTPISGATDISMLADYRMNNPALTSYVVLMTGYVTGSLQLRDNFGSADLLAWPINSGGGQRNLGTPGSGRNLAKASFDNTGNNISGILNAAAVVTGGVGDAFDSSGDYLFGANPDESKWLNGFLYQVVMVPRAVSDGDLPTWVESY
jgi:hypothetical protein